METAPQQVIKRRERDAIIQALQAGMIPRLGLQHIQVGRARETAEVLKDVDRIAEGGSAIRIVIGEYGCGKTMLLTLAREVALSKRVLVVRADLSPDRRLHATGGQALALYADLIHSMATRANPDGGALPGVLDRLVSETADAAREAGVPAATALHGKLKPLHEMSGGYDVARIVEAYAAASDKGDETTKEAALRWLSGEYTSKLEARAALGVRSIPDDSTVHDSLKSMAALVRIAGYGGMLVVLDEMVNLYKLQNAQARTANYEQILHILNDTMMTAKSIGFYFAGTPEFLTDGRRGLYSYAALQTRLAENRFAKDGLVDVSGPVIRLQPLSQEELLVLLRKLRIVHASGDPAAQTLPDEAITAFMDHCNTKLGAAYFRTPRNVIKSFIDLLSILEQNPGAEWRKLVGAVEIAPEAPSADVPAPTAVEGDGLAHFKL